MKSTSGKRAIVFVLQALCWIGCGGGGGGGNSGGGDTPPNPDIVETYTVNVANRLDITASTNGGNGYIAFSRTGSELSFAGFNTNDSPIAGITGFSTTILKFPITVGDSWNASGISNGQHVSSATVVDSDSEQVSVPAGTFTCVVTTETTTVPDGYNNGVYIAKYRKYFAPGVGLVKVVDTWKSGSMTVGELHSRDVAGAEPGDYFPLGLHNWWTFSWK